MKNSTQIPHTGFKGLVKHWKNDLKAGLTVALVAMPLGLALAIASNAPAISGILSAIVAGLVTTFLRSSKISINGPANGLIVVIASGIAALGGFQYVLATIVVAGGIMTLLGLLKLGKYGDLFPTSAVQGLLAAIGVIILAKQIHVGLGVAVKSTTGLDALMKIPNSILELHPLSALIGAISLLILVFYPKIKNKWVHLLPAPLWVLLVALPMVFLFDYLHKLGVVINPNFLTSGVSRVDVPDNFVEGFLFPNFSGYNKIAFWQTVLLITLIGTIETIISTKAVEKLDPYNRKTDMNRDLMAMGASTSLSGFIGGLPVITVIARSSVNIQQQAKTKWSNFFHGSILLVLIWVFPNIIQMIPTAALSAILIFAGFKLAAPAVFQKVLMKGWEQLIIMLATFVITVSFGLLQGVAVGFVITLLIHLVKSRLQISTFFKHLIQSEITTIHEKDGSYHTEIKGIANFALIPKLTTEFNTLPEKEHILVDFSKTKLVDTSVLDFVYEYKEKYNHDGGHMEFLGLGTHRVSSAHPHALHVLEKQTQGRLTQRQSAILKFAKSKEYIFKPAINWDFEAYEEFPYFEHKWIEYKKNLLVGDSGEGKNWEIADITYNDGVLIASELHTVTILKITMEKSIEPFLLTKEMKYELKDKWEKTSSVPKWQKWIRNFVENQDESILPNSLLCDEFVNFIVENEPYHIESDGKDLLVIRKRSRQLGVLEIEKAYDYGKKLAGILCK